LLGVREGGDAEYQCKHREYRNVSGFH